MAWATPGEFVEAIEWFRERLPITDDEFEALENASHRTSFVVSGVAQLDIVTDVWEALDRAIENGDDLDDFKDAVEESLLSAWGEDVDNPAHRIETIFRTNLQSAYGAGRHKQMTDPDVLEDHPIWQFDAILDGRTTEVCQACDNTKLPADNPWWKTHNPPLHHKCRSGVITMTKEEAGKLTKKPPSAKPSDGFGEAPLDGDDAGTELYDWAREKVNEAPEELAAVARDVLIDGPNGIGEEDAA